MGIKPAVSLQRHRSRWRAWLGGLCLLAIGAVLGILFQKYIGAGDLLRSVGLREPRPVATPLPTRTPAGVPVAFQGQLSLFILAGQSNMSGYGELPTAQTPHPQVFMFGEDFRWRLAVEPIDSPIDAVDWVLVDAHPGVGPGLAFAKTLIQLEPSRTVGLIPCAKGNTAIAQWQRNLGDESLYGACLKRVSAALPMGDLAGILFFQGEADALDPSQVPDRVVSADNYAAMFTQFVNDLRADLGRPHLPLVFAQIGSQTAPEAFTNWQVVQARQAAVRIPCAAMITTADMPLQDGVHYTREGYEIIGTRFAEAYVRLRLESNC